MRGGLGRRFAADERDHGFSVAHRLGAVEASERLYRYWSARGWWGDQGNTSQCVAFAWTHWLEDGPVPQRGKPPCILPAELYKAAQRLDEWAGEDYDGTSVRAGAKALKARGFIEAYHWATRLDHVVSTLLELGPMVVGTNWYEGMSEPDPGGFMAVTGALEGGHAWLIDGVSVVRGLFRMKNSWGRTWGHQGFAYLSFEDFERLLHEDGEACIAKEISK